MIRPNWNRSWSRLLSFPREDVDRLGYVIADAEAWVHYRNSITRASDVREKPDIKTIEAANDYISRVETSQLRSTGSGIAPSAANIYQPRRCATAATGFSSTITVLLRLGSGASLSPGLLSNNFVGKRTIFDSQQQQQQ